MIPPTLRKNFAETLQFEDLAVKNFFLFYYMHIFCEQIFNWYEMHFFMKKHFTEKNHSVFEGLKGGPFKHTKKEKKSAKFFF